jgi:hypothetical protein
MLTLEMINGNMVGGECRRGKNDVFVCLNTNVLNFRVILQYILYVWPVSIRICISFISGAQFPLNSTHMPRHHVTLYWTPRQNDR